jgi:hypothetical protein
MYCPCIFSEAQGCDVGIFFDYSKSDKIDRKILDGRTDLVHDRIQAAIESEVI